MGKHNVKSKKGYSIHFSAVFEIRLLDQDRMGDEWGRARIFFFLFKYIFFNFLLFQFSPIFPLQENGRISVYRNGIHYLKAPLNSLDGIIPSLVT